ncbi:hypothetical protein [Clostridium sp. CF012]
MNLSGKSTKNGHTSGKRIAPTE